MEAAKAAGRYTRGGYEVNQPRKIVPRVLRTDTRLKPGGAGSVFRLIAMIRPFSMYSRPLRVTFSEASIDTISPARAIFATAKSSIDHLVILEQNGLFGVGRALEKDLQHVTPAYFQ